MVSPTFWHERVSENQLTPAITKPPRPLFGLLAFAFYALFTLLPDSHSMMVSWHWVAFWQVGLAMPVIWLAWQVWQHQRLYYLGNGLDWLAGAGTIGVLLSCLWADFPNQARWYGWAALCMLAALYAIHQHISYSVGYPDSDHASASENSESTGEAGIQHTEPSILESLLTLQATLSLLFIVVSLGLWSVQTVLPELAKLRQFQQLGVTLSYDLKLLELRNWAPIGHQNYVAGYLVLVLPLLAGLAITQQGRQRWLWSSAVGLGCIDLYTTNSRGGWLGLLVMVSVSGGVFFWRRQRRLVWAGLVPIVVGLVLVNDRLRLALVQILSGQGTGELAFRVINAIVGWRIGWSHPWFGAGLGSVPLLYQQYRPAWAGREGELVYQLHNTPLQLWAELGSVGIIVALGSVMLLGYLSLRHQANHNPLTIALSAALLGYSILAITDYQLDNLAISGTIVLYIACLANHFNTQQTRHPPRSTRHLPLLPLTLLTILLLSTVWLLPIHRAWYASSQGFTALRRQDIDTFVQRLNQAQRLAAWEPYYPNQLGWTLGDRALEARDPQALQLGIQALQRSLEIAPHQEFATTNLGWLLLVSNNPLAAQQAFQRSATLVPAKRGIFYSLGISLLQQNNPDAAIAAFTLELLRDPQFLTSPIWRSGDLQALFAPILEQATAKLQQWLQQPARSPAFTAYAHQLLGAIAWWQRDWVTAEAELADYGTQDARSLVNVALGKPVIQSSSPTAGELAIAAWLQPDQRDRHLTQAWITATRTLPPASLLQAMVTSMNQSTSLHQWLTQTAPTRQYRRERLGFGVLSRHIDGSIPRDFLLVSETIPITVFFQDVFHNPTYLYDLDQALAADRRKVLSIGAE